MILATVGTQLPFDRMLGALDLWASQNPEQNILAQTGKTRQRFQHMDCKAFLSPRLFHDAVERAYFMVSHAGMGSILTAAELGKQIVIVPRRAEFMEHRNDHQMATAAEMESMPNVTVVEDADRLAATLNRLITRQSQHSQAQISYAADDDLLDAVSGFVQGRV